MRPRSLSRAQLGGLASPSGPGDAGLHLPHAPIALASASDRSCSTPEFSPRCGRSVCPLAIGWCSSCCSRMSCYGSLNLNKSKLFVLDETNKVVLTNEKMTAEAGGHLSQEGTNGSTKPINEQAVC